MLLSLLMLFPAISGDLDRGAGWAEDAALSAGEALHSSPLFHREARFYGGPADAVAKGWCMDSNTLDFARSIVL